MKFTLLSTAGLVASVVAAPPVPVDSGPAQNSRMTLAPITTINQSRRPEGGFVPVEVLKNACLKACPTVVPGVHASQQHSTYLCRLRCISDALLRNVRGTSGRKEREQNARARSKPVLPQELELLFLKKERLWNVTAIESRSEGDMAPEVAAGGNDDRGGAGKPKRNPCAWPPSEWEGSSASEKEMERCLKGCPGPIGVSPSDVSIDTCLYPCFLEVTERRCRENRAKEPNSEVGVHLNRRQFTFLPNLPKNALDRYLPPMKWPSGWKPISERLKYPIPQIFNPSSLMPAASRKILD
ncbi:hypothetical protein LX36DRAFT_657846 [Colletotrichum falcatum]|nr:hypothetical protein LX36DRAFT_657846 [Colletotrichum falcatum]